MLGVAFIRNKLPYKASAFKITPVNDRLSYQDCYVHKRSIRGRLNSHGGDGVLANMVRIHVNDLDETAR